METQARTQAESHESHAQIAGRLGGQATSFCKQEAARRNGLLGGRPKRFEKTKPPTFSYPGGKARMARALVAMMPQSGRRYIEPFAGRGNVFWVAAGELRFHQWHLNDTRTAAWLEAIRDHGHELKVPRNTRMAYYQRWADYKRGCPYARILEPYLTFSGAGFGNGSFRTNEKGGASQFGFGQSVLMAHHILVATDAKITAVDWRETLTGLGRDDFAYFDPPYLNCNVTAYSPDDIDHPAFINELLRAPYRWILSEYDSPLYRAAFGAPRLQKGACTRHGTPRMECVWTNM